MANNEFTECKLADACSSIDYGLTASAESKEIGPKFLRITDIVTGTINWTSVPNVKADVKQTFKYRLYDGDIVIARTGASTGSSAYIKNPPEAVFASYLVRLRIRPEFNARFISYYLKSDAFWGFIRGVLGDKSAQPNASASTMTQAPLKFPKSIEIQRRIAHILSTIDDKIELNRCQNETLKSIARALFQSWFVDFDPVRAKASGEVEAAICQRLGLSPQVLALFPAALEESAVGEVPAGWEVSTIGAEVGIAGGGTPSTKNPDFWDDGIYDWATPKDLSGLAEPILLGTERRITEAGLAKISSGFLSRGTVLMSSRAPVGYLAINATGIAINQGFIAMICDRRLSNYYTFFWCEQNMDAIKSRASGTTFLEISKGSFRPMQVLVPSTELMEKFSESAESIFQAIETNLKESRTLTAQRDELLPRLLSGEITVLPSF